MPSLDLFDAFVPVSVEALPTDEELSQPLRVHISRIVCVRQHRGDIFEIVYMDCDGVAVPAYAFRGTLEAGLAAVRPQAQRRKPGVRLE